jgi:predicted Holliday junction resolvase-like endonuclease
MDASVIVAFYKDLNFFFCFCPCCGQISSLSEMNLKIKRSRVAVPKYEVIMEKQTTIEEQTGKTELLNERYQDRLESLEMKLEQFADVEPIIVNKVRHEGRRQAILKIKKVDKIFFHRKIDPRDVRLIFSPIDFICFNGMTEHKEIKSINFLTRKPKTKHDENVVNSIEKAIDGGNVEFVLAQIEDSGKVNFIKDAE